MTAAEVVAIRAGTRRRVVLAALAAGLVAFVALIPWLGSLWPSAAGLRVAGGFVGAALRPALWSEDPTMRELVGPIPLQALAAAWRTIAFAAAAMAAALVAAAPLGVLASERFWGVGSADHRGLRAVGAAIRRSLRLLLTALRSVHELLWAVLLLAAVGLTEASAVVAIALPYVGILAKLFAEMIDEAPADAQDLLRSIGATRSTAFVVGLVPRALPDIASYAFYRFECALRSSAVLGFFGFPTLGLALRQSFENLHYREAWTYLWTLFALIAIVEWWSGALRSRLHG